MPPGSPPHRQWCGPRVDQARRESFVVITDQDCGICDADVNRPIQVRPMCVVVTQTDLPVFCDLAFDRKIYLLRQSILEVLFDGDRERQKTKWKAGSHEILV